MNERISQIQPVILCGGSGTRLWPVSRQSLPKQFVPLLQGRSLLELTFDRVNAWASHSITCVAQHEHRFLVQDAAAQVPISIILEPEPRNTAAAMAAAALNADPQQLLLFLPADHHIPDHQAFQATITAGIPAAEQGAIVTFGITPNQPHTGYGYIEIEAPGATQVVRFVEKPDQDTALQYLATGRHFWNAGIFLTQAQTLIAALSEHAPDILASVQQAVNAQERDGDFVKLAAEPFAQCRSESIDYAVLEHHQNIHMVPFAGAWSDVGSWAALAALNPPDAQGNSALGQGHFHQAQHTYIHAPHRPVVALGTQDLLIIDTQDAVLVAHADHAEQVKTVVAELMAQNVPQATEHRHAARPWGTYDSIDQGDRFQVKRIVVKPGGRLSLQKHYHRAEHWIVVSGTARVTCDDTVFLLHENESTFIPLGSIHRLENPGTIPLHLIEVQSGSYLGEDDIERFDDTYGRS
jgi:mannose-1-phosphate guanylyltransferase/mannose-6-phosphate isomerase